MFPLTLKRCHVAAAGRFLLTGVNIWALSLKLPMKIMMDMRWLSLSMRLNCIMKRSSSLRASRGFLSLSYCRKSFTSASVGKNRIKHSTKSTRIVRRSKLRKHKATETVAQRTIGPSCTASPFSVVSVGVTIGITVDDGLYLVLSVVITVVTFRVTVVILQFIFEVFLLFLPEDVL